MKKLTNQLIPGLTLLSTILFSISACSGLPLVPQLEQRTLRFSLETPTLEYQYERCDKTFLGICTHSIIVKDKYDLTDPVVRKQFVDMGFVAQKRASP